MTLNQLINQAEHYYHQGNYQDALICLQKATALDSNHAVAQINLSYIAYLNGNSLLALNAGKKAVQLAPLSVEAKVNYASALRINGNIRSAISILEESLELSPENALAWTQLNLAYADAGRFTEAVSAGQNAIKYDSALVHAYSNLAITLQQMGECEVAGRILEQALKINPKIEFLHKNKLMNLQYLPGVSSKEMLLAAQTYGQTFQQKQEFIKAISRSSSKILKIAYLCGDFRKHPVGWFILPLLAAHNRSKVCIYIYANQHIFDEVSDEIKKHSDFWTEVILLTDKELVEQIKQDEIDVLVDLSGHTGGSRSNIFALRAAPVQVSWLGYFASTGISEMDYVLLSEDQILTGSQQYFTEKLYPLKCSQFCYHPPDYTPAVSTPPHLRNSYITFGSFNNTAKLNTNVIRLWSDILHTCKNSRLILKWSIFDDPLICEQFLQKFTIHGIDAQRIELRGSSVHIDMLSEYGDIDIALDPFPFSGALTSCEALWMGVPVITLAQIRPVSRQTRGILKAINLTDLAVKTPDQYCKKALRLAQDPEYLTQLRKTLRNRIRQSALMDGKKMANVIEKAYQDMFQTTEA